MTTHSEHRYSITIHVDDLAVLQCLRALADFAQVKGNKRIVWGNTKESDWKASGHRVSFHFTADDYRHAFLDSARRLLPEGSWLEVKRSNNDPAQRAKR